MILRYSVIIVSLFFMTGTLAVAQSGSLTGNSALTHANGNPMRLSETSIFYQPAPRQRVFEEEGIVHVHIKQKWNYDNTANNQRKKNIKAEGRLTYFFKIPSIWQLPVAANPGTLPEIGGEINHKTQNQGTMKRAENLDFFIACRIVSVYENGNLHLEGTTSQGIGEEGKRMYVGGIARPEDIGPDNTIQGSRIVDLTIREVPSGNVYDTVRRPWGTRLFEHYKPF
ncbi:MAG: flagellar basal body L-ring protein FlgH [Planctomycetaceae bacterium]|nr:flagellar basal body L-ring protein FlgH [Planctomycetaceae bacterium]